MNTKARINLLIYGIGIGVCSAFSGSPSKVMVNADQRKWTISEHLLGLHVEYSNEADALYEDGRLIAWMASNRVSNIRYPGGSTTKYWNWKNPTGGFAMDRNDPKYGGDVAPPKEWMSLEEYFDLVDTIDGVPHLGVNHYGPYTYGNIDQGIQDAVDLVKYVNKRGYRGSFFYLGNEDINIYKSPKNAATHLKAYAVAMKKVDPKIKILFNNNNIRPTYLREFLKEAGDVIDICEHHGKWPQPAALKWGSGQDTEPIKERQDWLDNNPISDSRYGAFSTKPDALRKVAKEAGYPNLLMADTEWGMNRRRMKDFNAFTYSLVGADFLMQHFLGNYYMANFWNITFPRGDERAIFNNKKQFNPIAKVFELLAPSLQLTMVDFESDKTLPGFACLNEKTGDTYIYLLNKSLQPRSITFSINSKLKPRKHTLEALALVDTPDHSGRLESLPILQKRASSRSLEILVDLPALSYVRVSLLAEKSQ